MVMKETTIIDKYAREGVDIQILAELNACPREDIEAILEKAGVYQKPKRWRMTAQKEVEKEQDTGIDFPKAVEMALLEKIDRLDEQIKELEQQKKEIEAEEMALVEFIKAAKKG